MIKSRTDAYDSGGGSKFFVGTFEQEMAAVWATICSWFDVTDDMAGRGNKLNSSHDGLHTSGTGNPEKMLILVEATELDIRLTRNGIS